MGVDAGPAPSSAAANQPDGGADATRPADVGSAARPPEAPSTPEPTPSSTDFRGNEMAEALLRELARPLSRYRLSPSGPQQLAELGLAPCETRIVLETAGGGREELCAGGTVFGSGGRYVRRLPAGPVLVIPPEPFLRLRAARARLRDRTVLPRAVADANQVEVTSGGGRWLLRRSAGGKWTTGPRRAAGGRAQRGADEGGAWIRTLRNLRLSEYLPSSVPPPTRPATLSVRASGGALADAEVWLRLYRSGRGDAETYTAVASHTLGRVVSVPRWRASEAFEGLRSLPQGAPSP